MVRIYLENKDNEEKNKEKYVDIYFWSIVKAYCFGWLGMMIIILGAFLVLTILSIIFSFI